MESAKTYDWTLVKLLKINHPILWVLVYVLSLGFTRFSNGLKELPEILSTFLLFFKSEGVSKLFIGAVHCCIQGCNNYFSEQLTVWLFYYESFGQVNIQWDPSCIHNAHIVCGPRPSYAGRKLYFLHIFHHIKLKWRRLKTW